MTVDPRDELWEAVYDTYYESYFQELLADDLVTVWRNIDEATKVLVALTASGSVASGWAVWKLGSGELLWAILSGFVAVVAIVHASLGVPAKLKDWSEVKHVFTSLRVSLETFRHEMSVNPEFPTDEFWESYAAHRAVYADGMLRIQNDVFRTSRRAAKVQRRLNERLAIPTEASEEN